MGGRRVGRWIVQSSRSGGALMGAAFKNAGFYGNDWWKR